MKLTSLELLGFKSFLHRTTFRFDEGVTCIVGPNGCGKSNIVDAITWVLGERGTKSLRVKEMGDVIFHGSSARKQVNMAEVTMGLVNEEKEYAIKRRIYRDGTNEYYINGDMVRLKDIQDFFLGTGIGLHSYAIIEQGNIEYFTQMKPHERRIGRRRDERHHQVRGKEEGRVVPHGRGEGEPRPGRGCLPGGGQELREGRGRVGQVRSL